MTVARYLNVILGGCRRLNQRAHDDFFEGVFVDEYDVSAPPLHLLGGDEAAKTGVVSQAAVPLRHVHEGFGLEATVRFEDVEGHLIEDHDQHTVTVVMLLVRYA